MRTTNMCLGALAALMLASGPAAAQNPVGDFYKGKTVTIVAGSSAGGGLDTYARLLSRHVGNHIPGNPRVLVQNMPGAGSLVAARHLYAIAPRDGTHMAIVLPGALLDPLIKGEDRSKYDPQKFNYVGNGNAETIVCVVRRDAPVKTFADVFKTEFVVGGTGPGSPMIDYPSVLKNLLGAKVRVISGYKGSRETSLAVMKGEVHGSCGLAWSSAKRQYPDLFKPDGVVKVLAQEDTRASEDVAKTGAQLTITAAKTPDQRKALELFYSQGVFTRPFMLPPGVPADRVAAIRKAFMAAMTSAELQAEAKKTKTDAVPSSGQDVQALVDKLYASPPAIVAMLKKALGK